MIGKLVRSEIAPRKLIISAVSTLHFDSLTLEILS